VASSEESVGTFSDETGRWRICSVPRNQALVVRVKTDQGTDAVRSHVAPDVAIQAVHLVPRKVAATIDQLLPQPNRALIEFSVVNDSAALVGGVTLDVELPGDAGARTLTTGPTGLALIPDVAPGRLTVRARKIGYRAGQVSATVAAGRNTVPIVLSGVEPPTLETVRIIGDQRRVGARLDEFETRRLNKAATFFVTRDDIARRNPVDAWQMLQHAPGLKLVVQGSQVYAVSTRVQQTSLLRDKPCYMRVMIDALLLQDSMPNLSTVLPRPDEIHGIEVFGGPASIPLQYGGTGSDKWCGMISIWTR
jgi:hypothetical protein